MKFLIIQDHNFLRGLILGGQFWKCTEREGGRNIKTQDWPSVWKLSNYIMNEANPRFFQKNTLWRFFVNNKMLPV